MKLLRLLALLSVAIGGMTQTPPDQKQPSDPEGWGLAKWGMKEAEVKKRVPSVEDVRGAPEAHYDWTQNVPVLGIRDHTIGKFKYFVQFRFAKDPKDGLNLVGLSLRRGDRSYTDADLAQSSAREALQDQYGPPTQTLVEDIKGTRGENDGKTHSWEWIFQTTKISLSFGDYNDPKYDFVVLTYSKLVKPVAANGQQATPTVVSTDTPSGKKGDVISISGGNLQKELLAKVLLTDGENDFPVEVTEQTSTTVKFRIPDRVPPGRLALMALTTGKQGYMLLPRFTITVDQRGNFQVDDTYKRKAANRDLAARWLQEQNDIVMGKGERTLALIRDVTSWYRVDSTDREAVAKSRQLRDFYASFREEHGALLLMYEANQDVLKPEDTALLQEAAKESDEVESKLRRLKAMGFDLEDHR